jgi:nucleoside-diphosphate-sugar epimerase
MFREPLNGLVCECPVDDSTELWVLSPKQAIASFVHAHDLPSSAWGPNRALTLPGITISVKDGVEALRRIAGDEVAARVVFKPVERIQTMIRTFPARFSAARAIAMGFSADSGIDAIVKDYIASEGIKV